MIRFTCDCGKLLQAKDDYSGQMTRCPDCGRELPIPGSNPGTQNIESIMDYDRARYSSSEDFEEGSASGGPAVRSGKATASLVLGILSLMCSIFAGLPALVLGIWALSDISKSRGRMGGTGMAVTGMVFSGISIVLMLPVLLIALLLPAVQKVRSAANRMASSNNLKQLGLALHNYHDTYGVLPPAVVYDKDGKPLYSWRVLVLPYLEEGFLYNQFKLDEPWDSPSNKALLFQMPRVYTDTFQTNPEPGMTNLLAVRGKGTIFESDPQTGLLPLGKGSNQFRSKPALRIVDVTDGTSNTIMFVEAEQFVPWTAPLDLEIFPDKPLPKFSRAHPGGFNATFVDGSVRMIRDTTPEATLRALFSRNGGEVIPPGF